MSMDDIDDLFGGGGGGPAALGVSKLNDVAGGIIFKMERREEIDLDTKQVKLDAKGKPKPELITWVITDLRDPDNPEDDGARRIWWKGNSLFELRAFLRENELGAPKAGGYVAMKVIEMRNTGKVNKMKVHAATYRPPTPENIAKAAEYLAKWDKPKEAEDDLWAAPSTKDGGAPKTTLESMRGKSNAGFSDEPPF